MNEITFPERVSKRDFFRDLEKAKRLVNNGVQDYFILADTKAFRNNSQIGNTTLKDIEAVFGREYISLFRFGFDAGPNPDGADDERERYVTYSFRRVTKNDKRKLRYAFRFFPPDCWLADFRDAARHQLLVPFIQSDSGEVTYLCDVPAFRNDGKRGEFGDTGNAVWWKKAIEDMPDYFDCLFAVVHYRHTDCIIPIPSDSAKSTFRTRDKDADGVKRRLIHRVNQHTRKTADGETDVTDHLRGTSLITIDGVDVSLMASYDWSKRYLKTGMANAAKRGGYVEEVS